MTPLHLTTWMLALWSLPEGWAVTLLSATLAFAVPLLLAGIGECVVERAGVLTIGVEGRLLGGARGGGGAGVGGRGVLSGGGGGLMLGAGRASVVASHGSGSPWVGVGVGV